MPRSRQALKLPLVSNIDSELIRMFHAEWANQRGGEKLKRIAIVDDEPESQYLYPEFLLAREIFIRHGIDAVVTDAVQLRFRQGKLWAGGAPIDLVYNRLVDFSLERPQHIALRETYLAGAVVVTPTPRNHALLADKRNLTLLSDAASLSSFGLPAELARQSAQVPRTVGVSTHNATELWEARKGFFFKPATGHGAKAVYRGDKLTPQQSPARPIFASTPMMDTFCWPWRVYARDRLPTSGRRGVVSRRSSFSDCRALGRNRPPKRRLEACSL